MIDADDLLHFLDIVDDLNPEAQAALNRIRAYVRELLKPLPTLREIEESTDAA